MSNIQRKVVQRITIIERQVIQEIPVVQKNNTNLLELETTMPEQQGYMPLEEEKDYKVGGANLMQEKDGELEWSSKPLVQKQIPVYDYISNRERTRSPQTERKMKNLAYQDLLPQRLEDNYRSVHHEAQNNNLTYTQPSFNEYNNNKVTGTQEQRPIITGVVDKKQSYSSTSSDQGAQRNQRFDRVQRFQEQPRRYEEPIVAANNYVHEEPIQNRDEELRNQRVTGTKKFYMKQTPTGKIVQNKTNLVDPVTGKAEKYEVKTQTKLNQRRRSLSRSSSSSSSSNQIQQNLRQGFIEQKPYVASTSGSTGYDHVSSTPAETYLQTENRDILRNRQDLKGTEQYYVKSTPKQLITEKKVDVYDPITGQAEKVQIKTKAKRNSTSSHSSSDSQRRRRDNQEGKLDKIERKFQETKDKVLGQINKNFVDTDGYAREKGMIKTTANSVKTKEQLDYVDPITGSEQKATIKTKVRGSNINREQGKTTYDYKVQDTAEGKKKVIKQKHRVGGVIKKMKNKIGNIIHR